MVFRMCILIDVLSPRNGNSGSNRNLAFHSWEHCIMYQILFIEGG